MADSETETTLLSAPPLPTGSHRDLFHRFLERAEAEATESPLTLKAWRDLAESWRITQALGACAGNRSAAARQLGIGRRTLYAKMEKLGIGFR